MEYKNRIRITGTIVTPFVEEYKFKGEKFYITCVEVNRLSENTDLIPVIIPERILYGNDFKVGNTVIITGQIRTRYVHPLDGSRRLSVFVFAKEIDSFLGVPKINEVEFQCCVVKKNPCRVTPLAKTISDFIIVTNFYRHSYYIPCITWGRNAHFMDKLSVGTKLRIRGRFQSRAYEKTHEDGMEEFRTVYEVSCSEIEVLEEKTNENEN